jgi:hypothetical protein
MNRARFLIWDVVDGRMAFAFCIMQRRLAVIRCSLAEVVEHAYSTSSGADSPSRFNRRIKSCLAFSPSRIQREENAKLKLLLVILGDPGSGKLPQYCGHDVKVLLCSAPMRKAEASEASYSRVFLFVFSDVSPD